jgi:hypothetical protein
MKILALMLVGLIFATSAACDVAPGRSRSQVNRFATEDDERPANSRARSIGGSSAYDNATCEQGRAAIEAILRRSEARAQKECYTSREDYVRRNSGPIRIPQDVIDRGEGGYGPPPRRHSR